MACSIVKHRGTHLLYIFLRGQEIAQSKKREQDRAGFLTGVSGEDDVRLS
jgi:hypothetical protein